MLRFSAIHHRRGGEIVEKELYEPCDLEELLHCLLSLNSCHHHSAIISTFNIASTTAPDAVGADPEKPKRRKKNNLFEVVQFLPNWGLGYKLAKSHWKDISYKLTKTNLYKDGRHGKAWGIRYKAGSKIGDAPVKMSGVNKPRWKYLTESMKNVNSPSMSTQTTTPTSEEALH
ncbi:Ovate protein family C-terminal protein [Dioscorea alata]|uniref:Ovate protein family C-terminal protein n=1 Tax=Dioscorea alata TaxID=55571 RepID=A0ACB7V5L8_DIOAL|nr:Ovate protein family C-terminal protein [Dioscorea alata]